ncbi:unnamed protein product [Miscanthus lutarioriparius]|uniref:Uncharacterized protein n=1 Tax=Miscanthus lutarioriparius TaxID=422564 RepID=A0A811PRM9_9POAL|nr:unnamed protein product [Miscanthus lutarioriparius]
MAGRNILEGVVILHETIHEFHRKNLNRVIFKIDFEKAYDKNDQTQEKVAADPVEEHEANKLSSDKGSDDDYSQLQGSKGMLYKVESDSVDDEDQGRANGSGRNVGGATETEDEEDDDNCSDDMEGEVYLQQWVTDKLITLLDYPKSIGAKEIIRLAEDCSSTDDLVCMLVKSGFRSSSETCSFALNIYAKKLYQEDVVNRDVEVEEATELYLNTIENNEAHRQKDKMPEADDMHENAGEEKRLSVVLLEYE